MELRNLKKTVRITLFIAYFLVCLSLVFWIFSKHYAALLALPSAFFFFISLLIWSITNFLEDETKDKG